MNKTPAFYIFLGLVVGTIVGSGIGAWNGNIVHGMQLGALTGVFIGWIVTNPALQK
jgi:outer membrane lipoprotein SlyB